MKSEVIQQSIILHSIILHRQRRPFNIQHSTFHTPHSTFHIPHSTLRSAHSLSNCHFQKTALFLNSNVYGHGKTGQSNSPFDENQDYSGLIKFLRFIVVYVHKQLLSLHQKKTESDDLKVILQLGIYKLVTIGYTCNTNR